MCLPQSAADLKLKLSAAISLRDLEESLEGLEDGDPYCFRATPLAEVEGETGFHCFDNLVAARNKDVRVLDLEPGMSNDPTGFLLHCQLKAYHSTD